jgi:hypothetical protein
MAAIAAVLRAAAIALLLALLFDLPAGRARPVRPLVALDVSQSWMRGRDSGSFRQAASKAQSEPHDGFLFFGDSARDGTSSPVAEDSASRVQPIVDRALGLGRPVVIFTDGEISDPEALARLPRGSRVEIVRPNRPSDAAVVGVGAPRAAAGGDTITVRVTVTADAGGAGAGTVTVHLGDQQLAERPLDALSSNAERASDVQIVLPTGEHRTLLRAVVHATGDVEPRNDTMAVPITVSSSAGAVLVSTSPDFDSRAVLEVLRSALSIPTKAYYLVARGRWVTEGGTSMATEEEVRKTVHDAPLVVLHGDTAIFGAPRTAATGALALVVPSTTSDDWYPTGAPASPLSPALGAIVWDSLPPIAAGPMTVTGDWEGLETRRARRFERRAPIVGIDGQRRVVIVSGSAFWRWAFRGGPSADAFTAMWGGILDWLAEHREGPGGKGIVAPPRSPELLPRVPSVRAGAVGTAVSSSAAPTFRNSSWAYIALVVLLCLEWIVRRRAGLR